MYFRLDMKSVYAETLYNLNVSSEQAEFLCNPNVRVDVFCRNTSILLIDTTYVIQNVVSHTYVIQDVL